MLSVHLLLLWSRLENLALKGDLLFTEDVGFFVLEILLNTGDFFWDSRVGC